MAMDIPFGQGRVHVTGHGPRPEAPAKYAGRMEYRRYMPLLFISHA